MKTHGKVLPLRRPADEAVASEPDLAKLARLISAYAPHDGSFELPIPGVHASRFSRINTECVHAVSLPSLCIVAQGAKTVIVGQEVYEYDESRMIVFSVALPVAAQVTQASYSAPYLSLSQAGSRSPQDCRVGLEGLSPRSASRSREERRLRHSGGREHG